MSNSSRALTARIMLILLAFSAVFLLNIGIFASSEESDVITSAYALEDNVKGRSGAKSNGTAKGSSDSGNILNDIGGQKVNDSDQEMVDFFNNHSWGATGENLNEASNMMAPVTNILGRIAGIAVILTIAGVVVITSLDLLYIAIPPLRNILYKPGTNGAGGAMGMSGAQVGGAGSKKPTQWVSDEAVACAALLGGSASATPMGMGGMGAMGGMGGMGAMGGAQQNEGMTTKSVIFTYLKKRVFFLILLGICTIVLTSSAIMGTGVNLANWVLKFITYFNGKLK